jgi:hypothetical protein
MDLLNTLKKYRLLEFYLTLSPEEKEMLVRYSRHISFYIPPCQEVPPCEELIFTVKGPAQLLWTTAANAIPDRKWDFAEKLLQKALVIADNREDRAWIHANLTQLYHDQHRKKPEYIKKCLYHCHQLLGTGYFTSWAENMLAEVMVMHIH